VCWLLVALFCVLFRFALLVCYVFGLVVCYNSVPRSGLLDNLNKNKIKIKVIVWLVLIVCFDVGFAYGKFEVLFGCFDLVCGF